MEPNLHLKFMLAARLYHRGIIQIEEEPDLAYLSFVSAIEVLCQDTELGEIALEDVDARIAGLVASIQDDTLKAELTNAVLSREQFISRRFVKFILDHVEDEFWRNDRPDRKWQRIDPQDLEAFLKRIYKQRSRTLHSGEPFPPNTMDRPLFGGELDHSAGMMVGARKWSSKEFIPYPWFFEKLVNHVLRTFLRRHAVVSEKVEE